MDSVPPLLKCSFRFASLVSAFALMSSVAFADVRVFSEGAADHPDRFVDLTGFVQAGFVFRFADEYAGRTDHTPLLQRARLGLRAAPVSWLILRTELELAPTPQLQDAYVEWVAHDAFHVRLGQFQVPFLLAYQFNELHLGFADRPLYTPLGNFRSTIRYLSPRDVGFMASGRIPFGRRLPAIEYAAGLFLGRGPNQVTNDDNAFLYAARLGVHLLGAPEGDVHEGDVRHSVLPKVMIGGGVYSNCDDRENWNRGFTADAEFRFQGLYANASFVWFKNGPADQNEFGYGDFCGQRERFVDPDGDGPLSAPGAYTFVSKGAHVQLQYVLPAVLFPVRHQSLELLGRFDYSDPNTPYDSQSPILGNEQHPSYVAPARIDDSDNAPTRFRVTLGLNWYPTERETLKLQLNYQMNRELEDIVTSEGTLVGVRNEMLWLQLTAAL